MSFVRRTGGMGGERVWRPPCSPSRSQPPAPELDRHTRSVIGVPWGVVAHMVYASEQQQRKVATVFPQRLSEDCRRRGRFPGGFISIVWFGRGDRVRACRV